MVHLHLFLVLIVFVNALKILGVLNTDVPLQSHCDHDNTFGGKQKLAIWCP